MERVKTYKVSDVKVGDKIRGRNGQKVLTVDRIQKSSALTLFYQDSAYCPVRNDRVGRMENGVFYFGDP